MPQITTIGEYLYWCYANLAMAHAAVEDKSPKYNVKHFSIRSRLYKGLTNKLMSIGSIADDERLKMLLSQACCYCGSRSNLSIDHLIPKSKGGTDMADNMIWACRSCNSAKGNRNVIDWYLGKSEFPPLLLLRRYLKLVIVYCIDNDLMDTKIVEAPTIVTFSLTSVPQRFPSPLELRLWVFDLSNTFEE